MIVQAEDSENKLKKMGRMYRRMGLSESENKVNDNARILTIRDKQGEQAIKEIERHALVFKPDVVIVNPLTSFVDNVYKEENLNHFLRVSQGSFRK